MEISTDIISETEALSVISERYQLVGEMLIELLSGGYAYLRNRENPWVGWLQTLEARTERFREQMTPLFRGWHRYEQEPRYQSCDAMLQSIELLMGLLPGVEPPHFYDAEDIEDTLSELKLVQHTLKLLRTRHRTDFVCSIHIFEEYPEYADEADPEDDSDMQPSVLVEPRPLTPQVYVEVALNRLSVRNSDGDPVGTHLYDLLVGGKAYLLGSDHAWVGWLQRLEARNKQFREQMMPLFRGWYHDHDTKGGGYDLDAILRSTDQLLSLLAASETPGFDNPQDLQSVLSELQYLQQTLKFLREHLRYSSHCRIHFERDSPAAKVERAPSDRQDAAAPSPLIYTSAVSTILPEPFAWVTIPDKGYSIARYPITNAQYARFIEAGGYQQQQWWTERGWKTRESWDRLEPRCWRDSKWNAPDQPVIGVSWYEAIAFCLWLSAASDEQILLPTEKQWEYAAAGDDGQLHAWGKGRLYPWGNEWDCRRCNNSVRPCRSRGTTPVQAYEGKGDSPFGVVDMVGNCWEWCLTDKHDKKNDPHSESMSHIIRGAAWNWDTPDAFRCGFQWIDGLTGSQDMDTGFRIVRV